MKPRLNRREVLQLAALLSLNFALPRSLTASGAFQSSAASQNVLLVVFDALSALNVPLFGYQRDTMPNLSRLAERAVVYHNHFAAGNFTTPGTASLLTGVLPWTHRAINYNGTVDEAFLTRNIFHAFPGHYRLVYSHNPLVNTLFGQFSPALDEFIPRERFFLANDSFLQALFASDEDIATLSWTRTIKRKEAGYSYSLFLSHLYERYRDQKIESIKPLFPRGVPQISGDNYYLLEQATDWLGRRLGNLPGPFCAYLHFLPPHFPYKTPREFYNRFNRDGWKPVTKPDDPFTQEKSPDNLLKWRNWYDEYILYVDREFGNFFQALEKAGLLENTWVVFTSDHGETFERGISGHITPVLHQPLVRIPLLIFEPGRTARLDVHTPTSAIDVLPTLLQLTGQELPGWLEGAALPPYGQPEEERSLYALQARDNEKYAPLTQATAMLVKGRYKLVYYTGYEKLGGNGERVDLYDLESDPEELKNLYRSRKETAGALLGELKDRLSEVDAPYW